MLNGNSCRKLMEQLSYKSIRKLSLGICFNGDSGYDEYDMKKLMEALDEMLLTTLCKFKKLTVLTLTGLNFYYSWTPKIFKKMIGLTELNLRCNYDICNTDFDSFAFGMPWLKTLQLGPFVSTSSALNERCLAKFLARCFKLEKIVLIDMHFFDMPLFFMLLHEKHQERYELYREKSHLDVLIRPQLEIEKIKEIKAKNLKAVKIMVKKDETVCRIFKRSNSIMLK